MSFTSKSLSPQGRHVLITDTFSGLDWETTLHLAEQGFQVIAGVRRQKDGERLTNACPSGRISMLPVDVTDEESIGRAAVRVAKKVGDTGLWGLVNNTGIYISVSLECAPSDLLRRRLEANLIGQLMVTRAILPLLCRGDATCLANITPGLDSAATPYLSAYSAAQSAKEGMSDALRRGLAPMGIQVSVVSPGTVWTPTWGKITSEGKRTLANAPDAVTDLYRDIYLRFLQANENGTCNSVTKLADVITAIHAVLTAAKPRTRYRVGADMRHGTLLARLSPSNAIDGIFRPIITATPTAKEEQHA